MKKAGKILCVALLAAAVLIGAGVLAGRYFQLGPWGYLKYETFQLGEKIFAYSETEEVCYRGKKQIVGTLYLPKDGRQTRGIVILSHGLNGTARESRIYSENLAKAGMAVYAFDFCGGSNESRSSGDTRTMSVRTEIEDLNCVIEMVKGWNWVDSEKIVLMGESQGGLVSALTAAGREDIESLILLYPAFSLPDLMKNSFEELTDVPENFTFMGMELGRAYCEDIWELNPYQEIEKYEGEVLILHGTQDSVIPFGASKRACNHFENAVLHEIRGADHGFAYDDAVEALKEIYVFLQAQSL